MSQIEDRIRMNRFGKALVRVHDGRGAPLPNNDVILEQIDHAFLFGAIGFELTDASVGKKGWGPTEVEAYKQRIKDLCNFVTLPFYWRRYEPAPGQLDAEGVEVASRWFLENGFVLKGHPLCWHEACAPWHEDLSSQEFMDRQLERIRREVTTYAGLIDMWDVINEVLILPLYKRIPNPVTRAAARIGAEELAALCFSAAREAGPDATLVLNDFNLSGDYESLIERLLDRGVPIDVIGLQTHQHKGYRGAEHLWDVCERFSRFGLPLHFTETTILSGHPVPAGVTDLQEYQVDDWPTTPEGEERQCAQVEEFYSLLYSHPAVGAVTWWGLPDGGWLGAPNGLVRRDLSPKPAYRALMKRVRGEWWTDRKTLQTDRTGLVELTAAYGTYRVTAAGQSAQFVFGRKADVVDVTLG